MGTRLYLGTENGLVVLRSTPGGWEDVVRGVAFGDWWNMSGRPDRPQEVYVCPDHAGLYRTQDAGAHWEKVLDLDVRSVEVDPTDANVVYAGTEPVGLYRSEDHGRTWQRLPGIDRLSDDVKKKWWLPLEPHEGHVLHIYVRPDDPRNIHLALEHGGVLRSFDRGQTWEDVSAGIDYLDMHMIATAPAQSSRYFVSSARGFFASDDPADGWVRAENACTRDYFHDFAFLPPRRAGERHTMLVATAAGSPAYWNRPEEAMGAMFRSDDGAQSWRRVGVGSGLPETMQPAIWGVVGCAGEPDTAFIGVGYGRPRHRPGQVLVTSDRGDTWDPVPTEIEGVRALWAAPD